MARENNFVESYKSLMENKARRENEKQRIIDEAVNKREKFMNEYYSARELREEKSRHHGRLLESCRNDAFGTVIKAIFITALEANTLTDNGIILAENMVNSWIKENGGANKILSECKNKTYLLSRIAQIVEEAAILETEELENIENDVEIDVPEVEEVSDDKTETESEVELATKVIEKNLDAENDEEVKKALEVLKKKSEEVANKSEVPAEEPAVDGAESKEEAPVEDKAEEEKSEEPAVDGAESKEEGKVEEPKEEASETEDKEEPVEDKGEEEKSDALNDTFDDIDDSEEDSKDVELPDDATTEEDDTESDVAEDIVDDLEEVPEEDITVDGDTENNGKVFDELEKEEDVKKAIELIRQRVADAEETFIKRNAEDKKAIDELIGRISDNVKTVEDLNDEDNVKSKIAQESARLCKQKINEVTENRPLSILEKMTRTLHTNIVRDQAIREQYLTEDGNMDTGLIVEAAKVMYGFLETLNTLQLEKVDSKYIEKVLSEM